jgi:hypothetical protein
VSQTSVLLAAGVPLLGLATVLAWYLMPRDERTRVLHVLRRRQAVT